MLEARGWAYSRTPPARSLEGPRATLSRMDSENLYLTKRIALWLDYDSLVERTLQQVVVFTDVEDLDDDTEGGEMDFGLFPRMFSVLGFDSAGITRCCESIQL